MHCTQRSTNKLKHNIDEKLLILRLAVFFCRFSQLYLVRTSRTYWDLVLSFGAPFGRQRHIFGQFWTPTGGSWHNPADCCNRRGFSAEKQVQQGEPNKIRFRKKADFFVLFTFHYSSFVIHFYQADFE